MIEIWTFKIFEPKENKRVIKTEVFFEKIDTNGKFYCREEFYSSN